MKFPPMFATTIGGLLGSVFGYMNMIAVIPALIASDIPVPIGFVSKYQGYYFFGLIPIMLIFGLGVGKWRTKQIDGLTGWRRWVATLLLGSIVAVLGFGASLVLFVIVA